MEHDMEITRTHNEDPQIPDGLHVRCSCGWASSADDEHSARALFEDHVASGVVPAPAPYVPSPD